MTSTPKPPPSHQVRQPGRLPFSAPFSAGASGRRPDIIRVREGEAALPYYYCVPRCADPGARPLVAVHGVSRNAPEQAAAFAARTGRVVVAPLFRTKDWPHYQWVRRRGRRADEVFMAALDDLAARTGVSVDRVDIFGFSGGSQFAHRFAMLHPDRVGRLALASAGWYTFPSRKDPFPYGIAADRTEAPHIARKLHDFLQIPTLVTVGAADTERDPGLRKERIIDLRQGLTRVERGVRWVVAFRRKAERAGIRTAIEFRTVAGCGHSFDDCVDKGGLADQVVNWFDRAH